MMAGTRGVPSVVALARKCVILINVADFVADRPQPSAVADVLSGTARSPCTHCSFRCLRLGTWSNFAPTALIHSASSAAKGYWQIKTLDAADVSRKRTNYLGMNSWSISVVEKTKAAPLLKLANSLKENRHKVQTSNNNEPVVLCNIQQYIANCIPSYHPQSGIV